MEPITPHGEYVASAMAWMTTEGTLATRTGIMVRCPLAATEDHVHCTDTVLAVHQTRVPGQAPEQAGLIITAHGPSAVDAIEKAADAAPRYGQLLHQPDEKHPAHGLYTTTVLSWFDADGKLRLLTGPVTRCTLVHDHVAETTDTTYVTGRTLDGRSDVSCALVTSSGPDRDAVTGSAWRGAEAVAMVILDPEGS